MNKVCLIIIALFINLNMFAQNQGTVEPDKKTDWWGDIDGFLNQQAKVSLGGVDEVLSMYPPTLEEPLVRKMALLMIDNVLHEEKAAYRPAVQSFFKKQIEDAIEEIRTTKVDVGAVIWKLYNHTFIVKTPSVTLGFDIQRGVTRVNDFTLNKELILQLINVVDVLFISHYHGDHTDAWVAETFLSQNKPVISPTGIFSDTPIYQKILHPERKAHLIQQVFLPLKGMNISFVTYPGHQGEAIQNNVYLVITPDSMSFSHTGDQSNAEDFEWIDQIGDNYSVDVLMTNSWSYYPDHRLAKGFRPMLIIPGHENELGHTIDHREPYWLNYIRLGDPAEYPWVQMAWGEKFHYIPVSK